MPRFFKGIGGDAVTAFDPHISGFIARQVGATPSTPMMVRHILKAPHVSPFVSLTKSFEIARDYALAAAAAATVPQNWGYVYELNFDLSSGVTVYDPIVEIAQQFSVSSMNYTYHHDGGSDVIRALATDDMKALSKAKMMPGGAALGAPPVITDDLRAMVYALRDTEILALHVVPAHTILTTWQVR